MPRLPKRCLSVWTPTTNLSQGEEERGRERSRTAVQTDYFIHTVHFFVNVLMISQNIRFKPLQSRSKALSAASWLITPLISYNASERIKTWLKIYRNPHDTKILRGLYSAFLIYFAGFKLALANWVSPIQRYAQNIFFDLLSQFTVWVHISSSHRDTKILDENVNSFWDSFTNLSLGISYSTWESMYVIQRYLY